MRRCLHLVGAWWMIVFLLSAPARAEEEKLLNVFIWSDYLDAETVAKFSRETGIGVKIDVYDSNQTLETKLLAGRSGYDIVVPSAMPFFARQVPAGLFRKLRIDQIPNAKMVDPKVLERLKIADPQNAYGLPYMMAATGVGYNQSRLEQVLGRAPSRDLKMLYDPKLLAPESKCGVTLLDAPDEVFPSVLAFLGRNPISTAEEDLIAASQVIESNRQSYRYFHSSRYLSDLATGEICVAQGWVGDLVQAKRRALESKNGNKIEIFLPPEGASFNVDVLAIPKDAPHPSNAEMFINYILNPEAIAKVSSAIGYANAVPASRKYVAADVASDPVIYPPEGAHLYLPPLVSSSFDRQRNRAWVRAKTGR